jgi:hypothetical protein
MKVLLINKNDNSRFLPYDKQYRLFEGWKAAMAAAIELGWTDDYGMGINQKRGIANVRKGGPVDLTLMAIEIE